MPKTLIQFALALFVGCVVGWLPQLAVAQTTTGQSITVVTNSQATELTLDQAGTVVANRDYIPDHPFWVNRNECTAGWWYQVGLTTVGINGLPFSVWASQGCDCSVLANRTGTQICCWQVYEEASYAQGLSGTKSIAISAQDIVGSHFYTSGTVDTSAIIHGTVTDCDPTTHVTYPVPSGGEALTLYFMAFGNGSATNPTAQATWSNVGFDLIGPSAPATVSVASADTQLYVNWSQVTDSDLAGYHIYCKIPDNTPNPNANAALLSTTGGASSTGGDSSIGGSSSTGGDTSLGGSTSASTTDLGLDASLQNPNCVDYNLWQGNVVPPNLGYVGKASGVTPVSGVASGLVNGQNYVCAVSSYDTRENDGTFSMAVCGKPWWVSDFFTQYRSAGGKGGGGFCSIAHQSSGFGLLIPLASMCMLALRRGRRSARCRKSASK